MKERDTIIEKNKKAKGKKEEPVPILDNLVVIEEGETKKYFLNKNETFKYLNISLNKFDETTISFIEEIMNKTMPTFILSSYTPQISRELAKSICNKYPDRLYL